MREQARREDFVAVPQQESIVEEELPSRDRFVDGPIPPVQNGFANPQSGASDLVFAEDQNELELKLKVGKLVDRKFSGDYKKAFEHYDRGGDGGIDRNDLLELLTEAGVGNGMTRGIWATRIIERLDKDGDQAVTWQEFERAFTATA